MTLPTVSILIPTYNRRDMLKEAVASVLAQGYTDYEIIIVDNCSTDDTEAVVIALGDNRIKYHKNAHNIGAVHNYNKALRMAIGKYIYLFSDDDIMLANNLVLKVAVLDQYPQVGVVHSNLHEIGEDGTIFSESHWASKTSIWQRLQGEPLMPAQECYSLLYNGGNFISMPSAMVRKSFLDEHKLEFNNQLKFLIDWDLWLKTAVFRDFYFLKEPLIHYRHHKRNEAKLVTQNSYFQELVLIKLSLLKPIDITGEFGIAINQITESVKKQLMLDMPLMRNMARTFFRYVPFGKQVRMLLKRE
jgi:glycosyltransferase involved in cell wall biosynthesis